MVCAKVVLSCLAMLPLAVFGNMESQDTKKSTSPNYEKVETWVKNCHNEVGREAVESNCIKALERIFKTVGDELVTVSRRDKKGCGKKPKHDTSNIDAAYTETICIWRDLLDNVFCNIPSDQPLVSSDIKNEAVYQVENLAKAVYTGINVTVNSRSTSLADLQTLQNKASCSLSNVGSRVYGDMRVGHKYDAETSAAIHCHRKNTISAGTGGVRNMFRATRILKAAIDSGAKTGIEDDLSLLEDILKETNDLCRDWARNVFETVDLLCRVNFKEYV